MISGSAEKPKALSLLVDPDENRMKCEFTQPVFSKFVLLAKSPKLTIRTSKEAFFLNRTFFGVELKCFFSLVRWAAARTVSFSWAGLYLGNVTDGFPFLFYIAFHYSSTTRRGAPHTLDCRIVPWRGPKGDKIPYIFSFCCCHLSLFLGLLNVDDCTQVYKII